MRNLNYFLNGCRRLAFVSAICFLLSTDGIAQNEILSNQQTTDEIQALVKELESPKFRVRQLAAEKLWDLGRKAEPFLQKALSSANPEVVERARLILRDFEYGIYPDTDKATINQIRRFRDGTVDIKRRIGFELMSNGKGLNLLKLLLKEPDTKIRAGVSNLISSSALVRPLLEKGELDAAIDVLRFVIENSEQLLVQKRDPIQLDYLWLLLTSGRLEKEIERYQDDLESESTRLLQIRRLAANGQTNLSLRVITQLEDRDLADSERLKLLAQNHRWKELSDHYWENRQATINENQLVTSLQGMTYHRLAGQRDRYQDQLKVAMDFGTDLAAELAIDEDSDLFETVNNFSLHALCEFLLINGENEHADTILRQTNRMKAFEHLSASYRNLDALRLLSSKKEPLEIAKQLTEKIRRRRPKRWSESTAEIEGFVTVINEFHQLGFYKECEALYRAAFSLANRHEFQRFGAVSEVCDSMVRNGQTELFFELIKPILNETEYEFALTSLFGRDLPHYEGVDLATYWWGFMKEEFGGSPFERLKRLQRFLRQRPKHETADDEFTETMDRALQSKVMAHFDKPFLAEAYLLVNDQSRAINILEDFLKEGSGPAAMLRLGDLYRESGETQKAYDVYLQSWEALDEDFSVSYQVGRSPIGLYLAGLMARKLEQPELAKRHIQQAKQYMLFGSELVDSVRELSNRKFNDEARELAELGIQVGEHQSWIQGSLISQLVDLLPAEKGDQAGDLMETLLIDVCVTNRSYSSMSSYSYFALLASQNRFDYHIKMGDTEKAKAEVAHALSMRPCSATIAEECLPALRKLDPQTANKLFEEIRSAHKEILAEFPNSGLFNNNLAWICTTNKMHLDEALKHAELAVKNEPENDSYLDTLADVCFNLGDTDRAIELMKKCLSKDPKSEHFQEQLERFQGKQ